MQGHDVVYMEKQAGGIAVIRLNQPMKKNAINARMMDLLRDRVIDADFDEDVRVIILRGEGGIFSSGGDLSQNDGASVTPESSRKTYRHYCAAISAMRSCAKPIVAMVNGYAVGGGFSLALASDFICVSSDAKVIPAFCQIGIAPEMAVVKMLCDLVGQHRAKEILFLGEMISGVQLGEMGIAYRVCPEKELEGVTYGLARRLSEMPDASIQVAKTMINSLTDDGMSACFAMEQTASPFCTTTAAFARTQERFAHA